MKRIVVPIGILAGCIAVAVYLIRSPTQMVHHSLIHQTIIDASGKDSGVQKTRYITHSLRKSPERHGSADLGVVKPQVGPVVGRLAVHPMI